MFHPLARPPVREGRLLRQKPDRAFTLIELLAVIAIIGILTAITFGIVKGANERAAIGQAKSELAVLSQALEAYKQQYGAYPQTGASPVVPSGTATATTVQGKLFNALMGKLGPGSVSNTTMAAIDGKTFIDPSKFSLQTTNIPKTGDTNPVDNGFLDPWGRLYMYYYQSPGSPWTQNTSYILFSAGPDGQAAVTVDATKGTLTPAPTSTATDVDNIYANKN